MVNEPTVEDAISILRGLKSVQEVFHGVKINDGALVDSSYFIESLYFGPLSAGQSH